MEIVPLDGQGGYLPAAGVELGVYGQPGGRGGGAD
jgi:hypothetical protein